MVTTIRNTSYLQWLKRWGFLPLVILVLVCVGIYFNSLTNIFTNWDDGMIYSNSEIRNLTWDNLKNIFTYKRGTTYQPIRVLSYAIDYHFWGLNPLGYHITNILFYVLTCITVFFAIRLLSVRLRKDASQDSHQRVAIFGAFLFAAHPVHVEAVTWLAARKEVLQGFFFFLAFYLYLKGSEQSGRMKEITLGLCLFSTLLAILSKPSAIVFPAVILIYEIARRKNQWASFLKNHWPFLVLSVFISVIFISVLVKVMVEAGGIKPYRGGSFLSNVLVSFYAFLYNVKLLIVPANYSASYTLPISNPILSMRTSLFVGMTLFLFALSFWSLKHTKVLFFSFLFFFVTILPYLNIIPISTLLADRYVFIASFSYCFLLGVGFNRVYAYKNIKFSEGFFRLLATVLFLFVVTVYSLTTMSQNTIWENSYTLWKNAVEKYPDSNTANALMGVVYMEIGMDDKAAKHLEQAIEILPYDYQSRNNLGIVYGRLNEPHKALQELMTAMRLMPEDDTIKINLSVFYQRQKEYEKAEKVLQYLVSKNPKNAQLHFRLGLVYRDAEQYDQAASEFLKSSELAPEIINPYVELGNLYATRLKDLEKAKYYYTKGIEAAPKATLRIQDLRWMVQDLERHQ
jgi:Flp pilus assembly protein TadD